jgi:hypothetical protein
MCALQTLRYQARGAAFHDQRLERTLCVGAKLRGWALRTYVFVLPCQRFMCVSARIQLLDYTAQGLGPSAVAASSMRVFIARIYAYIDDASDRVARHARGAFHPLFCIPPWFRRFAGYPRFLPRRTDALVTA